MTATAFPGTGRRPGSVRRAPWLALAVLTLINLVNYLDRLVVPAVEESIKHSALRTTDAQFGMLGSAFFLVYVATAPVFGIYGDRPWRLRLVAAGIAVWSVATASAGLAQTYGELLASRALVGIGEAAYSAIAPAVLADYFPDRLRGRVYAVFYAAIPIGSALGYLIGGQVDHRYGWRAAFFVAGIPGLILAALTLTIGNPVPGERDDGARGDLSGRPVPNHGRPLGVRTYLSLLHNVPYVRVILGYAAYTFALGGIQQWMPAFLERVRSVPGASATTTLGGIVVLTGFVGTFLGGWIGDALQRRHRQGYLWLSGTTMVVAAPLAWLALARTAPSVYWTTLAAACVFLFMSTSPINAVIVGDVPPAERAAAMAASIFTIHILGDVPAPTIIGALSDATSLSRAVLIIPGVILVSGGIWLYAAARRPSRGDSHLKTYHTKA